MTAMGNRLHQHSLPAELDDFIGRERERAEIGRLLAQTRLLTVTGPGGSGKTRLALRLAADLAPRFPDGVRFVPLADLTDSTLVPRAAAGALAVRGTAGRPLTATLAASLASRRLLLVLDNCEHLIGACARLVETLVRAAPHLRILATSREPLRIPGEVIWRLSPLALPAETQTTPSVETLSGTEAVALLLARAQARQPGFALTAENAPAIAALCRQVEGLPLGIELAAAQIGALTPEQVLSHLDHSLTLLRAGSRTLPRQETMQATLDWSHHLLSPEEQILFRRLAVFAGSFDLEAAEGIGSGDDLEPAAVLPLLLQLVEKSLVEARLDEAAARYRLLQPVRAYAAERLVAAGEREELQRRHARYYLALAETAEPNLMSGRRGPSMERLAREQENVRAAFSWSPQAEDAADREIGLRLAGALAFYWNFRGEVSEGLDLVERALAAGKDSPPDARAKALYCACELAWLAGHTALARERAEESEALWRALGDKRWLAYTLQSLPMAMNNPRAEESVAESRRLFAEVGDAWGAALAFAAPDLFALLSTGDPAGEGQARLEAALVAWRALSDNWGTAQALNMLGDLARSQGDDAAAAARYQEALELLRQRDLTGTVPSLLHNLGYLALHRHDARQAHELFRESLRLFRDQGDQPGIADALTGIAGAAVERGDAERAAELFGAAEAVREVAGAEIWPANLSDYERNLALLRGRLDPPALAAAWTRGRTLPLHEIIIAIVSTAPAPDHSDEGGLTAREREVAALVAQGLTNRQIGAQLFITEGTARLHVKHILQKLGFTSRAQIAAWAVEHDLSRAQ